MEPNFWHERWDTGRIAFHESAPNAMLVKHFQRVMQPEGARVFVPLCGKALDMPWLASRRYRVVGAELSEAAVRQLYEALEVEADVAAIGALQHFSADNIEVYQGDIFDLDAETLGAVDIVYDRAALVAMPPNMRTRYAAHVAEITAAAPQFLNTVVYDQSQMNGPPFSVDAEEIKRCLGAWHDIVEIDRAALPGGLKGVSPVDEAVWLLKPR